MIDGTHNSSLELLIEEFVVAKKKRSSARTFLSVLIVFILGIYIGLTWNAFANFKKRDIDSFDRALSQEAQTIFLKYTQTLDKKTPQSSPTLVTGLEASTIPSHVLHKLERIAAIESELTYLHPSIQSVVLTSR